MSTHSSAHYVESVVHEYRVRHVGVFHIKSFGDVYDIPAFDFVSSSCNFINKTGNCSTKLNRLNIDQPMWRIIHSKVFKYPRQFTSIQTITIF